jgi:phosphatidylethanolamine-binding protein (PEBP) family uncharacterized protein
MALTSEQRRLLEEESPDSEPLEAAAVTRPRPRGWSFRIRAVVAAAAALVVGGVLTGVLLRHKSSSPVASPPPPPPPAPPSFSTKNISVTEWLCSYATARLDVSFEESGGPPAVACGFPEVLQNSSTHIDGFPFAAAGFAPTFTYAAASDGTLYTLLVADRDATSQADPWSAPVKHFATGNLEGVALRLGYGTGGVDALWFNYAGPRPPAWSGCHRYYAHLYEQPTTLNASSLPDTDARTNWDFVSWAAGLQLRKVAVNFFMAQDLGNRTLPCS